jgi:phosphomannomutase
MRRITDRLRTAPPATLLGRPVESVEDLAAEGGRAGLPRADVLILRASGARVVVRPSGTEPKLKCYLEVVAGDLPAAGRELEVLRGELTDILAA